MGNPAEVYDTAMQGYQAAILEEQAAYQKAELTGDIVEQVRASQAMASLRVQANEYHAMAEQHARSLAPPMLPGAEDLPRRDVELCRKYGVTPAELPVAKGWTSDPKLSDDDRVRVFVENRQRYRHARATGQYRDDQGTVRR